MPKINQVMSVGFEGVGIGDFVRKLKALKTTTLIDARTNPDITTRPAFKQDQLEAILRANLIEYIHDPLPLHRAYKLTANIAVMGCDSIADEIAEYAGLDAIHHIGAGRN